MKEILITSSALILALLALRRVFRKTLSRRWQYALWALVLARLLIPNGLFSAPATDFSVLTATAPVQQAVSQRLDSQLFYSRPVGQMAPEALAMRGIRPSDVPTAEEGTTMILMGPPTPISALPPQQEGYLVRDAETNAVTLYEHMAVGPWELLAAIWKVGMAAMALFFLTSNLFFYRKLRKARREFTPEGFSGRKVYLVPDGAIPSPCLFGRSIYITPAVADDPAKLRHVLSHESTHAKHLDPVWSLLRCVCLTIYWFDPLVWVAASCSKTDCELACDESVLKALGEQERIGYGETLLSLIPVKKGPANPMLAATTMTAGKRELRDRITRIAQRPRQVVAAVVAVALLASVAAACTFTKGWSGEADGPSPAPAESVKPEGTALRALTGEELRWFNEEFFNSAATEDGGYNLRNQFANPINLYDRPEDIDLYELFYLEGSTLSDEELKAVFGEDLPCPAYKLTTVEINDILMDNVGLTLDKANKDSLTYEYRPEYGAYFWMHGDTNYCGDLQFTVGTREGDTVKLYHNNGGGGSWYCVTLRETDLEWHNTDSNYYFLSHQECENPAIPTPMPSWEPDVTIPLSGLEPYVSRTVATANRPGGDFDLTWPNMKDNWNFDGHHVVASLMEDGMVLAGVERSDGSFDSFFAIEENTYGGMFFFHNLLGHDGFYVDYVSSDYLPSRNYYYFRDNGALVLLLEINGYNRGGCYRLDLDGDGSDELVSDKGDFFFSSGGKLYHADTWELLTTASSELPYWEATGWNIYGKYYDGRATTKDYLEAQRTVYFDGENLLVYKPQEPPTVDHMAAGVDKGVPEVVVTAIKDAIKGSLEQQPDGTWTNGEHGMTVDGETEELLVFDDWRIESIFGPYRYDLDGATILAWGYNHELHAQRPELVCRAGGRYVTEDGWVSPGYPGCLYVFFQEENGSYTYLWEDFYQEGMTSDYVNQSVAEKAAERGVSGAKEYLTSYAVRKFQADLDYFTSLDEVYLSYQPDGETNHIYPVDLKSLSASLNYLIEEEGPYRWSLDYDLSWYEAGDYAKTPSLSIIDPNDWSRFIRFWPDSEYVMSTDHGAEFYRVENLTSKYDVFYERNQIFNFMRRLFDEVEWKALRSDIAIPDDGRSREAIAKVWAEAYEGAYLKTMPDSSYHWSYMKVVNVKLDMELVTQRGLDQNTVPFSYSTIFVPNDPGPFMAGNTGEYEGNDPDVPQGALQWWRHGYLKLGEDGLWRCNGTGTGW